MKNPLNNVSYFMATFESNVLGKVNLSRIKVHQRKDPISWQLSNFLFKVNTAIPYRESTGFLQGIPCVVIPLLHALAVYRV